MVVQRTLNKIEELKERPHHERRAVALYGAVGVVIFLGLIWGLFTLRSLGNFAMRVNGTNEAPLATNQDDAANASAANAASAAAATQASSPAAPTGYTASSTNGRVEIVPIR